ncbi:MAG TPA: NmrA/HSCARG family protein [bacterium]
MRTDSAVIVVTGATGQQGGAVARHLLAKGWKVRALTRDVNKPAARALAGVGAEVKAADNEDRASLERAMRGAYGAFSVQNFWLPGVGREGEVRQGRNVADAAKTAGIAHFVYTSVGAAHRGMGQAHFASKWEIEQYIQALHLPHTILRPVAFMDNFNWQRAAITNGTFTGWGLRPEKTVQLIAADDIGAITELVFAHLEDYPGKTLELAGDELTEPQIAATLGQVIGRPVRLAQAAVLEGGAPTEEQLAMHRFFNGEGYSADIQWVRRFYPALRTFERWLHETGWENAPVEPMPSAGSRWEG